jgi:hypothetical protein
MKIKFTVETKVIAIKLFLKTWRHIRIWHMELSSQATFILSVDVDLINVNIKNINISLNYPDLCSFQTKPLTVDSLL